MYEREEKLSLTERQWYCLHFLIENWQDIWLFFSLTHQFELEPESVQLFARNSSRPTIEC